MNKTIGKIGAGLTGAGVLSFAISMLLGFFMNTLFVSCLSSIVIAIGFLPFIISVFSVNKNSDKQAVGMSAIAFAVIYAVLIFLVYYAECTTIRMNDTLSKETLSIISYGHLGSLFFNYDLLGYSFMGLSTFLIGFTVAPENKGNRIFRTMLWIHGIFFFCLILPLFPIFTPGTSDLFGVVILEIWCAYFLPVCVLGYRYFSAKVTE